MMDISAYLRRIQYQGSLEPTLETLQALHKQHMLTVPFEDLSIHYGQPIILQEELLYNKIVQQHRGGFCYELNGLFAWLLRQLGFRVTMLSAGVASDNGSFGPEYDHLTLLVHQLAGANWLADVGFGDSFLVPLRFEADIEQDGAEGHAYRLHRADNEGDVDKKHGYWILQRYSNTNATWQAQYRFTLQPHILSDFGEMCHYQQTSPGSHFTQNRICSLATPTGRITLSGMRLIMTTDGERNERVLGSEEEYKAALGEYFGVVV